MRALSIVLLLFGLLALVGGVIVAAVSRIIPNDECIYADQYRTEAEKLSKEAENERDSSKKAELQAKALDKMQSARTWSEGCGTRRTGTTIALIAGLLVSAVGFVMAIAGVFIFRKKRVA
jgi:hypothetical protein